MNLGSPSAQVEDVTHFDRYSSAGESPTGAHVELSPPEVQPPNFERRIEYPFGRQADESPLDEVYRAIFSYSMAEVSTPDREEAIRMLIAEAPERPFCLLNEGALVERARVINDSFLPEEAGAHLAYAVKANPRQRILELLTAAGIQYFDCASLNEVKMVREAVPWAQAYLNHPIQRVTDVRGAKALAVNHFTAQSLGGVRRIIRHATWPPDPYEEPLTITVRLATLNGKASINLSKKYGASVEAVRDMIGYIRRQTQAKIGIAINVGSQNESPEMAANAIKMLGKLIDEVGGVDLINLGGGIPVNYHPGDNFNLEHYVETLNDAVRAHIYPLYQQGDKPEILIEPGRALCAPPIDLVVPVLDVEREHGRVYLFDGVFGCFSDKVIHNWKHPLRFLDRRGRPLPSRGTKEWTVHGITCDSGDTLGKVHLPENIQPGHYVHVPSAGAYMDVQGGFFNGYTPPEYFVYNRIG